MTDEVDQPRPGRGRGRPRMPEEDKKRHSITFRMRTELRARYAHQAEQNGCSISEEIERTLEKDIIISDIISNKNEIISQLRHNTLVQKDIIQRYGDFCENLRQHNENIVSLIGSFIERTINASDQSENIVVNFGKRNDAEELLSQIKNLVDKCLVPKELSRDFGASKAEPSASEKPVSRALHPRMPMPADLPSAGPYAGRDLSIAALRDLLAQFRGGEPDLEALRAAGWPALFNLLPTATRTALIRELRESASDVYLALMSPGSLRNEAVTALRRLQAALLPHDEGDEGPHDGPDDFDDIEPVSGRARR